MGPWAIQLLVALRPAYRSGQMPRCVMTCRLACLARASEAIITTGVGAHGPKTSYFFICSAPFVLPPFRASKAHYTQHTHAIIMDPTVGPSQTCKSLVRPPFPLMRRFPLAQFNSLYGAFMAPSRSGVVACVWSMSGTARICNFAQRDVHRQDPDVVFLMPQDLHLRSSSEGESGSPNENLRHVPMPPPQNTK